jgi:hypothetical protein
VTSQAIVGSREKQVKRILSSAVLVALVGVSAPSAQVSPHAYFDALVARAEFFKGASFRPVAGQPATSVHFENQLVGRQAGGYAQTTNASFGYWVTYNPAADRDPARQDAAKVIIPAFSPISAGFAQLATNITSTATTIPVTNASSNLELKSTYKVDQELMIITARDLPAGIITVARGQHGSTAAAHSAGTALARSTNSLQNQIRVPVRTTDGHSYVFTWDSYWTEPYLSSGLTNHKAFQLTSGGDNIWFETTTNFGDTVGAACHVAGILASVGGRSYNKANGPSSWQSDFADYLGPLVSRPDPLAPQAREFCLKANAWTRFWIRVDQRANDYDYLDMWVADETREAVQIFERIPVSVRSTGPTPNQIDAFWLEYNTSTILHTRGDQNDLVAYARNFAVLRDLTDVRSILARPVPGATPVSGGSTSGPSAPSNVRILRSF